MSERNIPFFINKDLWSATNSNPNLLEISIWCKFESSVSAFSCANYDSLTAKLKNELNAISDM